MWGLWFVFTVLELDLKCFCKVIAKVVGSTCLKALAVVHHCFDGVGSLSTGEFFGISLFAANNRHSKLFLTEISIDVQDHLGLVDSLLSSLVHGVAFLPEELTGAQEWTGGFFPTNNAAPLVVQFWQVTVGFDDVLVVVAEQGLGGWTNAQTFFQLFGAAVGNPCNFRSKTFYVVFFLLEQAFWNEQRHSHVLMSGLFELSVQNVLDVFPDRIAVWANDHAAFNRRVVTQFCFFYDIGIPFCKVDFHRSDVFDHFFVVCHEILSSFI